jgi:FKBP-type peptidyl-prolyl cis-trans isomerase FklB
MPKFPMSTLSRSLSSACQPGRGAALALLLAGLGTLAQAADAPAAAASAPVAPAAAASTPAARLDSAKMSYASGVVSIRNFTKSDVPYDLEAIIQGMRDAHAGKPLQLSEKEIRVVMNQLQTELRRSMAANLKDLGEKNRKRGADYLAAFKAKPGVKALSNGVAYRVVKEGSGAKPTELDVVEVRYRGTLIDGTEFDATEENKTALLKMNQVIMGWREALKQMPQGSRWEIVIPSQLAYGERGVGQVIGPHETLAFDVELIGVKR